MPEALQLKRSVRYMRDNDMMTKKRLHPIHPGEVLLEEFLKPLKLSRNRLALQIGVHSRRINEIVHGKRRISAETALRLARFFGTTPQFWLGLQEDYDLNMASDFEAAASRAIEKNRELYRRLK